MRPSEPANHDSRPWATDHVSPNGASAKVSADSIQRLVVLGYITAVAMPPIGFIIGVVLAVRLTKPKRGLWIVAVSVVGAVAWVLAVVSGVVDPNSTTST